MSIYDFTHHLIKKILQTVIKSQAVVRYWNGDVVLKFTIFSILVSYAYLLGEPIKHAAGS